METNLTTWAVDRSRYWAEFLSNKMGIPTVYPNVAFNDRLRTRAGTAFTFQNRVEYNLDLLCRIGTEFEATIAHEIAHIIADRAYGRRCKHDNNWRYVFSLTGYPVKRCHNYDVPTTPNRRFLGVCNCGKQLKVTKNLLTRIKRAPYVTLCCRFPMGKIAFRPAIG